VLVEQTLSIKTKIDSKLNSYEWYWCTWVSSEETVFQVPQQHYYCYWYFPLNLVLTLITTYKKWYINLQAYALEQIYHNINNNLSFDTEFKLQTLGPAYLYKTYFPLQYKNTVNNNTPTPNHTTFSSYSINSLSEQPDSDSNNKLLSKDWKNKAVKIYINAKTKRNEILNDNVGKSGIYLWQNMESKKCYVGQAQNLGDPKKGRLLRYYHKSNLIGARRGVSLINRAILKYGHHNFLVAILEFCPISILDEREQFWLDQIKPEYNILKYASSTRGYKHTLVSLTKMRGKRPLFSPSLENRIKIGKAAANRTYTQSYRDWVSEKMGKKIYVYDLNNKLVNSYHSISKLKEAYKIKLHHKTLYKRISEGEIFNNHRFSFSPLGLFSKNNTVITISDQVKRKKICVTNIANPEQSLIFNTLSAVAAYIKEIDGKSDRASIRRNLKSGGLYKNKWKLTFASNPGVKLTPSFELKQGNEDEK
jgi:group I intron endonuclease